MIMESKRDRKRERKRDRKGEWERDRQTDSISMAERNER